tara:strand:- start:20502 stop:21194 length:693 start_codon:yes stop_codon:yes gene_type:complete
MSWTDNKAIEQIKKLRDDFEIDTLIETGSFRGVNAELHSGNFNTVITIESDRQNWVKVQDRVKDTFNVLPVQNDSWEWLRQNTKRFLVNNIYYLDAHFYQPNAKPEDRWVVVKELQTLKGLRECIIIIHDFKCSGLGHLVYDGQPLDWSVVGKHLKEVNPHFHYYVNRKEYCDINTEETVKNLPITVDEDVLDGIRFANSSDVKRYRGILYATPAPLDLNKYDLVEYYGD